MPKRIPTRAAVLALAAMTGIALAAATLAAAGREGGETIADATPIPALPYTDTGFTCDNLDDYDWPWPYSGGDAPDVVYAFTPEAAVKVAIDLCGSAYDTRLFLAYGDEMLMAANDDYYTGPPCGAWVSYLEAVLPEPGEPYYIIVDGYGGECGDYALEVRELPLCPVACPDGAESVEIEPDLFLGYVDTVNGQCGLAHQLIDDDGDGIVSHCARTGMIWEPDVNYPRDLDWLRFRAVGSAVTVTVETELDVELTLHTGECDALQTVGTQGFANCGPPAVWPAVPGGIHHVMVQGAGAVLHAGFDYVVTIDGVQGPVRTESTTWSGVKALYD